MSYALGQPVPLTIQVKDSAGAAADATSVTLTVTRPDGTPDTYSTGGGLVHPSTGTYQYDYVPAVAGLFTVRWVTSGVNASAPKVDSFYVEAATLPPIVSLAEARAHLNLADTSRDDQLATFLLVASQACEDHTGQAWRRQTLVATFDGGPYTLQLRTPVISVTSVTENGTALVASNYVVDQTAGFIRRAPAGLRWSYWQPQNVVVTYVAGPLDGTVPATIRQGVLEMVRHLWETQRSRVGVRGPDTEPGVAGTYSIPNRVQELWDSDPQLPGFA